MNKYCLKGILPAMMIAFDGDGNVDNKKNASLTKKLIGAGVDGLYVGGSSAEMILCTADERKRFLEAVMENKDEGGVIAHIGSMSTAESIDLAKHAASVKVDAISSVTPLYFKYRFEEVKNYYKRLCDASGLPMIIYSIPALSGTTYNFEQISELLSIEGVAGMKFTMSDFFLLNRLKNAFPDKIFYNGADEMLLSGLAAGADGGIGTTYNFMPELMVEIYRLFCQNRVDEAWKIQSFANKIIADIIAHGVIPASKQMITFSGVDYGICREPFLPLDEKEITELYRDTWLPLEKYIKNNFSE